MVGYITKIKGFLYISPNMARNVRVRRLVVEILYEHGPMTKTQMFNYLTKNYRLLREPTEHSLSSIMNKNSQVIAVGTEIAVTEQGNKTTHILFDVDRKLIRNRDEMVKSMPVSLLTKEESKDAKRCLSCVRILETTNVCVIYES